MRRFFFDVPEVKIGTAYRLGNQEARHIKDVLRLRPGTDIRLFNDKGQEFTARINDFPPDSVEVTVREKINSSEENARSQITIAQALLKQKKMDTLVRQLTELGVNRWLPLVTDRVIVKPEPKRINARLARWENIARESLKQCRRNHMPQIMPPLSLQEVLQQERPETVKIIFTPGCELPLSRIAAAMPAPKSVIVLLGPEGGFTPREIEQAEQAEFIKASLGPRILKADTASVAACALIQAFFGDMG